VSRDIQRDDHDLQRIVRNLHGAQSGQVRAST
jgi:hypothetical protein